MIREIVDREPAIERFTRQDYKEWTGNERLSLNEGTVIKATLGAGTKFVLHSFIEGGAYAQASTDHFTYVNNEYTYERTYLGSLVKQETVEEEIGGRLYYLRAIIRLEDFLIVPIAQPIEVVQTMPEDDV